VSAPATTLAAAEFDALGTIARVVVSGPIDAAGRLLRQEVDAMDLAASRFRDDSELMAVNRAAGRSVIVGPVLLEAVDVALRAARLTNGAVDPTVGEALELLGYDRDFRSLAPRGEPITLTARRVPGWRHVEVERITSRIRVPAGVQLDLGATAKALTVDRSARRIQSTIGGSVLVSLGGDIAVAGPPPPDGWTVRVTDDHRGPLDAPGQSVSIASGGLATSSTTVRRWERGDTALHHVVDPATGLPAAGPFRTVTVAAASCVDANIASTAAIVRGAAAPEWLAMLGLPARLVRYDDRVVTVGDWPAEAPR
jgi:thiamine biosynthesis lipoprotein ApbE